MNEKILTLAIRQIYYELRDFLFSNEYFSAEVSAEVVNAADLEKKLQDVFEGIAYEKK